MIDPYELIEPYTKDSIIDWDYVGQNLAMSLTSPSATIRKLAEIYNRNQGDTYKCNSDVSDNVGQDAGSFLAASYIRSALTAKLMQSFDGCSLSASTLSSMKAITEQVLNAHKSKRIINEYNNLAIRKVGTSLEIYQIEVNIILNPWTQFLLSVVVNP